MQSDDVITQPHAHTAVEVLRALGVSPDRGLDDAEARRRRRAHGRNLLRESARRSAWRVLAEQFRSLLVGLLGAAAAVSLLFGEWAEATAIAAVIVVNTAIGFATELKAVRSMEALKQIAWVTTKVRRAGRVHELPAQELVPGDIVLLEAGDVVTADLRLVEASNLQCDESVLTGESLPVHKTVEPLERAIPVADRVNLAFNGTAVTRGSGEGVVVATGMATELGRISALVDRAGDQPSPLERRLDRLGGQLVWVALGLAGLTSIAGIAAGQDLLTMVEMGIALAVAAVPEGLPIVATIALARGMWRMAQRNALIRHLPAVETLGATTTIFTDKTGTLTENRMTATCFVVPSGRIDVAEWREDGGGGVFTATGRPVEPLADAALGPALRVCVLCNGAFVPDLSAARTGDGAVGDPTEIALLVAGAKAGLDQKTLLAELPVVREEAFDPAVKMMATFHRAPDGYLVAVKGAPEPILERASSVATPAGPAPLTEPEREAWQRRHGQLAREGLRVLALAVKTVAGADARPYEALTLLGLVGLLDPPRKDVPGAIAACRRAGVRVVMVTGDHAATARHIAAAVGITDDGDVTVVPGRELGKPDALSDDQRARLLRAAVFARVSPEQKLDLIALYQARGAVVAMTGDGVNDAPALRKADIGIAMGQRGTQVAREAADMVLRDDAFSSIVAAMRQGRIIFANIRKFVLYLLSCNLSELLVVGVATLAGLPLPILPLQILYLNLVTDVFPALALGAGEGETDVMRRPPRDPRAPILGARSWIAISVHAASIMAAALLALVLAVAWLGMTGRAAGTVSFLTLAFAQLWHMFNMREPGSRFLVNEVTRNRLVWAALLLCVALILAAVHLPGLSDLLKLPRPGPGGWTLAVGASLLPWLFGQVAARTRLLS